MRALLLATILLVPTSLISADGFAQTEGDYRVRMSEAVAEFDAHRFVEARALFRRAHGMSPSARTLRGIGLASFELGDYVEARRTLSASLTDLRRALTDEQRAVVSRVLSRAVHLMGLTATEAPPHDAVTGGQGAAIELTEPPSSPTAREPVAPLGEPLAATASAYEEAQFRSKVATMIYLFAGAPSFFVALLGGIVWGVDGGDALAVVASTAAGIFVASSVFWLWSTADVRDAREARDAHEEGEAEFACGPFGLGLGCVGRF